MFIQLILLSLVGLCRPHGYLQDPPSRSSMWRFGFDNPINWNDNELFCGGFRRQWVVNNGKCGICGDPWDEPQPRANENGGKYGNGIIVETYENGQTITAAVNITAHHKGHFEFRICPVRYENQKEDQDCLDQHVLELADGSGYKYILPLGSGKGVFLIDLKLPHGLTCERCVFQWHYRTANTWGICEDGTGAVGCGPQETFRGCADIRIEDPTYENTSF
ncbi:uncharacterized protein LOC106472108 [Limulus polyphemus]|uniref:Uncharacterized protein LOC106472108 n=1 Tax=Limulus polyphemus TaxID=6850 RepID=A0ABM1TKL4_LIMPO|nr:uncharacterized protein LOC106472108 [Limulus polyphemus]